MSLAPSKLEGLSALALGHDFFRVAETGSTQDDLKRLIDAGHGHGTTLLADRQTSGKGTRGRSWFSLEEPQILLSFAMGRETLPESWPALNVALGIVLADYLRTLGVDAGVKWPNDIYVDGKKIAGILSEVYAPAPDRAFLIFGIGLNYRATVDEFPHELRETATALSTHLPYPPSREDFLAKFFPLIEAYFMAIHRDPERLCADFRRLWVYPDRPITIDDGIVRLNGWATDIRPDGALLVKSSGNERPCLTGTVRLPS